jgi:4-amino-4-deoxy-L-arabinose transferase-like glycosyltransferase
MTQTAGGIPSRRALATLGGFALAVRLAYVAIFLRHYQPDSDARQYVELATSVAHGHGLSGIFPFWFSHPSAFRPPLYPLLLGVVYRISGDRLLVGMLANVVIGSAVVVLVALLAARIGGKNAAIAAGIVAALAPPLLFNDGVTLSEPLSLLLMLGAILFLLDGRDVAAAVSTGLLMLTRPSAQALAVLLALWMLRSFGWRRALRFVLVAAAVVAPWVARNYVELGTPVLVTSNGFNLAATYSPFVFEHNGFLDPFYAPEFASVRYQHFTEPELDNTLRRYAFHDIREHPHNVGWHVKRNLRAWFELDANENDTPERIDGRPIGFLHATLPLFFVTLALGAAGFWLGRRRSATRLMLLVGAYFTATSVVTVAAPRLRAPLDVFVFVAAGVAIAALVSRFGPNRPDRTPASERDAVVARPCDPRRNRVLLGCLAASLVVLLAVTFVARRKIEHDASHKAKDIATAVRADIDHVASQYPVDAHAQEPGFDVDDAPDRIKALDGKLWALVPQAGSGDRQRIRRAAEMLYDVQVGSRILNLMLIRAAFSGVDPWTPDDVRQLYESKVLRPDPTLPTWDELLSGDSARAARKAVIALGR